MINKMKYLPFASVFYFSSQFNQTLKSFFHHQIMFCRNFKQPNIFTIFVTPCLGLGSRNLPFSLSIYFIPFEYFRYGLCFLIKYKPMRRKGKFSGSRNDPCSRKLSFHISMDSKERELVISYTIAHASAPL